MKNTMLGVVFFIMLIFSVAIIFAQGDKSHRENEMQEAISTAIESTMKSMYIDKTYTVDDTNEFVADFMQSLLLQIDSNTEVTVNILDIDFDKGLFSVEVVGKFQYFNGKVGNASCKKTILLEQYDIMTNTPIYTVEYMINSEIYKAYTLKAGSPIVVPVEPEITGVMFGCWVDESGNEFDFIDSVTGDIKLITCDLVLNAKFI